MEDNNTTPPYTLNLGEQVVGVVLCAIAGMFAGKLTEKAFTAGVTKFRTR